MKKTGRRVSSTERALARTNVPIGDAAQMPKSLAQAGDGFVNLVAQLGTTRDKRSGNSFDIVRSLTRVELDSMYRGNWVAARIVDAPAEDATREGWNLSWDGRDKDEGTVRSIQVAENDFDLRGKITEAMKWGRLYGGGALVFGIKGQNDWSKPLVLDSVKKGSLEMVHVLDRYRLAATGQIDSDRTSRNFGLPVYYQIAEAAETVSNVHWSRVVIFNGKRLPYFEWQRNGRWHDSALQVLADNVKDYEATRAGINSLVFESNVDVLSIRGLAEMLSTPNGAQRIIDRVALGAGLKSTNGVWIIDGGPLSGQTNVNEMYQQKKITFSGVNEVFEKVCMYDVCGASEIPITRMFGRSPGGLNSTGEGDEANYVTRIKREQMSELYRPLMRIYEIVCRHTIGRMPENFSIDFRPLVGESAKDKASVEFQRAQRDQIYYTMGAVTGGLIARELKDDGIYRTMEDKDVELAEEMDIEPEEPAPLPGKTAPGEAAAEESAAAE